MHLLDRGSRTLPRPLALTLACWLLAACAQTTPVPTHQGLPIADADRPAPAGPSGTPEGSPTLPQPDSLDACVAIALAQNPEITAASLRVQRLRQRAPQLRSLDDPMLMVSPLGEMAETAAGRVDLMASISQRFPLTSRLQARARVADLEADQADADLQAIRVRVAAEVRRAYWSYFLASRTLATMEQSRAVLHRARALAEVQFRSGSRPQQDVLRAAAQLADLDGRLASIRQQRDSAGALLRRLMGVPPDTHLPEPAEPSLPPLDLDSASLVALAHDQNPSVRRALQRQEQFAQQERVADLSRWPDLTVSLTYNAVDDGGLAPSANGRDQWWISLGINLPIWDAKYDAAQREARIGRIEAAADTDDQRNRVRFGVEDALFRLRAQRDVLDQMRNLAIPQARAAVDASLATYRVGQGDFTTVLDNWRALLAYEVLADQALASTGVALADLLQALGTIDPPGTPDTTAPMHNTEPAP